jgi:hypothetical protein
MTDTLQYLTLEAKQQENSTIGSQKVFFVYNYNLSMV